MYESSVRYLEPRAINVQIFDMSAPPGRRSIYFNPSRLSNRGEVPLPDDQALVSNSFRYAGHLDVGGRDWVITCVPTASFAVAAISWTPWKVFAITLLLTAITAAYVWLSITHQIRLSGTNSQLNREIEERIRAEQDLSLARDEALESSRLKSQFLANVSHEIRTPMNGVIGMTELLLDTPLTSEQREIARTVQTSGEALLALINNILDLSAIEAGKLPIDSRDFSPKATLESVLNLLGGQARSKGLQLASAVDPKLPLMLTGDSFRFAQVLTNLIGNGIKFTERGMVKVDMRLDEETAEWAVIRCDVKDTGIGIAPEGRLRLFESFYQADGSLKRRFGGTGLGLAISKELVERMGGNIGLETEEGVGSNFWFTVRLARAAEAVKPVAAS
jgi:signal transduction histidine kinase